MKSLRSVRIVSTVSLIAITWVNTRERNTRTNSQHIIRRIRNWKSLRLRTVRLLLSCLQVMVPWMRKRRQRSLPLPAQSNKRALQNWWERRIRPFAAEGQRWRPRTSNSSVLSLTVGLLLIHKKNWISTSRLTQTLRFALKIFNNSIEFNPINCIYSTSVRIVRMSVTL